MADDEGGNSGPTDPELEALQLAQKKIEARKAILEASSTAVSGAAKLGDTLDLGDTGGGSLAAVEASRALQAAARAVADIVLAKVGDGTIILVDDRNVAQSDVVLAEVKMQLGAFETAFERLKPALPGPGGSASGRGQGGRKGIVGVVAAAPLVLGLVGAASAIAGMLRTDIKVSSRTVTLDRVALMAEVAGQMQAARRTARLPDLGLISDSAILARVRALIDLRYDLEERAAIIESTRLTPATKRVEALQARVAKLYEAQDKLVSDKEVDKLKVVDALIGTLNDEIRNVDTDELARARGVVSSARGVFAAFDAALAALKAPAKDGAASPLAAAALRERIHELHDGGKANVHLLFLDVSSAGGDVITKNSGIPLHGDEAAFLGGCGVTYLLAKASGELAAAGTVHRVSTSVFDFDSLKPVEDSAWN